MRDLGFKKEITTGYYLDPFNEYREKKITIESRYDEITGVASRILPYRMRIAQKPDLDDYLEKSPESLCPFCADLLEKPPRGLRPALLKRETLKKGKPAFFPIRFLMIRTTTWQFFIASFCRNE